MRAKLYLLGFVLAGLAFVGCGSAPCKVVADCASEKLNDAICYQGGCEEFRASALTCTASADCGDGFGCGEAYCHKVICIARTAEECGG